MTPRAQSYLSLALCILLWASIPVASKKILAELTSLQMLLYSSIFSVVALGALVLWQRKMASLASYTLRDYAYLSWLGFLGAFLYYVLLYGAFARTSAAEGFVLAYTWPILISLLAVPLLGERISPARLFAIAISFSGVVVIVTRGRMVELRVENLSGNLLALCGALVFALFSLQGKRAKYDLTIAAFVYFCAALSLCLGLDSLQRPVGQRDQLPVLVQSAGTRRHVYRLKPALSHPCNLATVRPVAAQRTGPPFSGFGACADNCWHPLSIMAETYRIVRRPQLSRPSRIRRRQSFDTTCHALICPQNPVQETTPRLMHVVAQAFG